MNIGIDIRTLMDKNYSGVSWYTLNLVRAILENDRRNHYKLFYNSFHDLSDRIPAFNYPNVEIIRLKCPNKLLNFCFHFFNWPKIDKRLGVDIFLMPNVNFISLSKNCRSILTIHDLSFLKNQEFFTIKRRLWHWFINIQSLTDRFDKIVAVSENTRRDVVELLKINPDKVELVYSGISEEFRRLNFEYEVAGIEAMPDLEKKEVMDSDLKVILKVKRRYDLPEKFFLYLGTIEPRKNVAGLIRAYNIFRDYDYGDHKLIIAGARGWKSKNIFSEWKKSKYQRDIIFLSYIDERDKVFIYNLASIFIFPSFYEGFGFPPLEAIACGTPVITSFNSSLNEIVGEGALLVDPSRPVDIALAMKEIVQGNFYYDVVNTGKKIKEKYNWDNTGREVLKIIKTLKNI